MNLSIRTKMLVFNLGMVVLLLGLGAFQVRLSFEVANLTIREAGVADKVQNLMTLVGNEAGRPIADGHVQGLNRLVDFLVVDADFKGIVFLDVDGGVLLKRGEVSALLGALTTATAEPSRIGEALIGARVPIESEGEVLGAALFGYGLERVFWAKKRIALVAFIVLLVLAGTVVASLWFSGRIMRQLNDQTKLVARTAQELKASAAEILAVSKQTETNSTEEAAAVDETRQAMMALMEASNEIADASTSVATSAERSADASSVIADRNATLNQQAQKISDLAEAIRGIADKTDILALNASLEGSRAGEAGRAFVLVGQEMRRLAETVVGAVKSIKQISTEIGELAQGAVLASEEGQKLATETLELSRRITLISGQQRSGTEQVTKAMDELQQYTQHALAGAREVKSTADALVVTAEELGGLLAKAEGEVGHKALAS